jgi:hypothetical protein
MAQTIDNRLFISLENIQHNNPGPGSFTAGNGFLLPQQNGETI